MDNDDLRQWEISLEISDLALRMDGEVCFNVLVAESDQRKPKGSNQMSISAKDVARTLDTTPRTLRKFLRASGMGVGQGSRYEFEKREMVSLTKKFNAWNAKRSAKDSANDTREENAGEK
jgi:hypothetical protein